MDQQKSFSYTYSAAENREVLNIRKNIFLSLKTAWKSLKGLIVQCKAQV